MLEFHQQLPNQRVVQTDQTQTGRAPEDPSRGGTVEIYREGGFYVSSLRTWRVVLDGEEVVTLREGDRKFVSAAPGQHSLRIRSGLFLSSPVRNFDLDSGQHVVFRCWPKPSTFTFPYALFYQRCTFIRLERAERV